MANEASKTKLLNGHQFLHYLQGKGIDIGCGQDPILPTAMPFDQAQGDANHITQFIRQQFDYVFSSHALEHMHDPAHSFREWFQILKPGGHMVLIVPDEDLYEQGTFPSRFNSDHKYTFTINKNKSWSPRSVNWLTLIQTVPAELVLLELQEDNYDRRLYIHQPNAWNFLMGKICGKLRSLFRSPKGQVKVSQFMNRIGAVVDQTSLPDNRLAQIMVILRKKTN